MEKQKFDYEVNIKTAGLFGISVSVDYMEHKADSNMVYFWIGDRCIAFFAMDEYKLVYEHRDKNTIYFSLEVIK